MTACLERKNQETKTSNPLSDKPFVISNMWMRPGSMNRNTAAFMSITNNMDVDDTLYSVQSDLAKVVQLHETYEAENDMMGMRHVDFIVIPSKSTVELKPGSFHIMLIGLNKNLKNEDSGWITAKFKVTDEVKLPVKVK